MSGLKAGWLTRYSTFRLALNVALDATDKDAYEYPIIRVPVRLVSNVDDVEISLEMLYAVFPNAEGAVLHSFDKQFSPGKRCWGTQRLKAEPTIDLRVVGFEEAISQDGDPKGMVGRINCELVKSDGTTSIIGIGPGKMTHADRLGLWSVPKLWIGGIIEVKYMRDPTYDALRQPTFQRWRPDKTEADVYTL